MRSLQCVKPAKRPALVAYTGASKSHATKREETCLDDWQKSHHWETRRRRRGQHRDQCVNCLTWAIWEGDQNKMVRVVNKLELHSISLVPDPPHPSVALGFTVKEEEALTAEQIEMRNRWRGKSKSRVSMYLVNTLRAFCEEAGIPITDSMKKGDIVDTIVRVVNGK